MRTQAEKATIFRALHARPGAFIIPNPWDAGTARLLAALGFEALATTSLGLANMLGRSTVSRDEILENCQQIAAATSLPVNVDLENCGADEPKAAAEAIRLAAQAGAIGGSIEDATGDPRKPIYDFTLAVERVQAAVAVARSLPVPFMLTARAENFVAGRADLDDTIRRLRAFEAAGADVLYAPGLKDLATIRTVVSSVSKPVNVVMTHADPDAHRRRPVGRRRQAHQRRRQPVALRARGLPEGRARDEGARRVQLHPRSRTQQGDQGGVRAGTVNVPTTSGRNARSLDLFE